MTNRHQAAGHASGRADETPADELVDEALRVELAALVTTLDQLAGAVAALVDTRQRGLGFLSPEGKAAQDAATRAERDAIAGLRAKAKEVGSGRELGGWTVPDMHGATPSPGNLAGLSVDVELWTAVRHQLRRIVQAAGNPFRVGWLLEQLPDGADTRQVLARLRTAIWEADVDDLLLQAAVRDLRQARDTATRLVDGDDRVRLGASCPHCGRDTLVVTFRDMAVTCDRDPATGRHEACTCPDPLCECKTRPYSHRHRWWQHRANKHDGWDTLARSITRDKHRKDTPR